MPCHENYGSVNQLMVESEPLTDPYKQVHVQIEKQDDPPPSPTGVIKKNRKREKIVHVVSLFLLVILTHLVLHIQWLIPIFYAAATPVLIVIRIVVYLKNKWQYFLIDFCYYANLMWYIYIWIPDDSRFFGILFGIANGPLLWAMLVYRNSLVFHDFDKCTSTYIHLLPGFLSFIIRWYPEETSKNWVKDFKPGMLDWEWDMLLWLVAMPLLCFMLHSGTYACIVHWLKKPGPEHLSSFNYLGKKKEGCLYKMFTCCGQRLRTFMFYFFNWLFCFVTLFGVILSYNFFIAHCILLIMLLFVITLNAANYYIDVFSIRGFVDE